mgnify:CR=1 FL=1
MYGGLNKTKSLIYQRLQEPKKGRFKILAAGHFKIVT